MSGIPDLELTPDSEFANRLEQTLIAEMGFPAVADSIPSAISGSGRAPSAGHPSPRWMTATAAILVAAASVAVFVVQRTETRSIKGMVPPSTTAPTVTTTESVPTTEALPPAIPRGPLEAGVTYRAPRSAVLGKYMEFTNAVEGALVVAAEGGMALTADQTGFQVLLVVADYSKVRFFTDPLVDAYSLQGVEALTAATNEAPADFFAYFASLPGVVTGPITDAEIAGRPAKAMTWSFGVFEGGFPCGPAQACVNAAWLGNWVSSYFEGNSGTTYLLEIDGQLVLVEVQNLLGAQDVADSLVITD